MNTLSLFSAIGLLLSTTQLARANVEVVFKESAPKDSFILNNESLCNFQDVLVKIDLSQSTGRLIFDTTASGAGVEVFQPFEISQGKMVLTSANDVNDGDTALSVRIDSIMAGEAVSFTIDVDDTLPKSELGNIRVSGSEIAGGTVTLSIANSENIKATFSSNSTAIIKSQTLCAKTKS